MAETSPRLERKVHKKPDGTFSGCNGLIDDAALAGHWREHSHDVWEIILILHGNGILWTPERRYPFTPGTIFCIPLGMKHYNQADHGYADFCIGMPEYLVQGERVSVFHDDERGSFRGLMELYDHIYQTEPLNHVQILGHIKRVMQALLISWQSRQPSAEIIWLTDQMLANVSNARFRVAQAIAQIPLDANYVRKQFREAYGMPPVAYMNRLRMAEAKALLLTTQLPVGEVAARCGFDDVKYFTRLFSSLTNYTPLKYRKFYNHLQHEAEK